MFGNQREILHYYPTMMKTNIKDTIDMLRNIPTYLDWFWKGRRIHADFQKMKAEWIRIGGFKASTGQLLNFVSDYSLLCVEYATWTQTTIDDQIVGVVRYVITDHRDILIRMIDWIRSGREPSEAELLAMTQDVRTLPTKYGSPMMLLYVITTLYQILRFLKSVEIIPTPPKPDVEPSPVRRPVLNLVKRIKEAGERRKKFFFRPTILSPNSFLLTPIQP